MTPSKTKLAHVFPYIVTICGAIGLLAAFILSYDTLAISRNAHYVPACNLNPIISCGSVIKATGDKVFGLPYSFYGVAAFAMLLATGMAMLAGATFRRWFWRAFQAAVTLGVVGAYLLLYKSMYTIHALCPYCLLVDIVVTILAWYTTLYTVDSGVFSSTSPRLKIIYRWLRRHHVDVLLAWFIFVIVFVLHHFWYYYGKYL